MSIDREQRDPQASALRELFREQWLHLLGRIVRFEKQRRTTDAATTGLSEAVERLVEGTDARLRLVGGYQKRLRRGARALLDYMDATLQSLSPVIDIDRAAFATDPLVSALFSSQKRLLSVISQNREIYNCLERIDAYESEHLFAIFTLAREDKTVFGSTLQGDLVVRDVKQTSAAFHSHRIVAAEGSETRIRAALKRVLFEAVVAYIRNHMTNLRHGRDVGSPQQDAAESRTSVENPWDYLEALERLLRLPRQLIRAQHNVLQIDSMGIVLPEDTNSSARRLAYSELTIGDNPAQIVCIARLPRREIPERARLELPAII